MRRLVLLSLFLFACTLTLEVVYPGHRISGLRTQSTYCTSGNTRVDFAFTLEGRLDRLEFFWLPEGLTPDQARPEERYVLYGLLQAGGVKGWLEVTPSGEVQAASLVAPRGLALKPQGIIVEPLPERRLWLRGYTGGLPGPYVPAANRVYPDSSPYCDPTW
ncbi:hypothetical protein CSW41_12785 [Thermus scotoductus]|uniref:Uncharacterized protein n=1 Tax=Thermus scotoductus TaxID=37636 RepID=A0A430RIL3_THESC|nr:hypothetical protein [Thermus scotoductus]RTH14123.1 hypothetical protein CSW41_12785 [Thermus scotoductus]